jgi:3-phytase
MTAHILGPARPLFIGVSLIFSAFTLSSCDLETNFRMTIRYLFFETADKPQPSDTVDVYPLAETEPVLDGSDAADDPAIWVNPDDPIKSFIIGTNKRRGFEVYALDGSVVFRLDSGLINNADIRTDVPISGENKIVVAASNRSTLSIDVYELDPASGHLTDILADPIPSQYEDPYGLCLYRSPKDGAIHIFSNDQHGPSLQWRLTDNGRGKLHGERVRTIPLDSQAEGCVADDANGIVYIGEEDVGIWKLGAEPDDSPRAKTMIAKVRASEHVDTPDFSGDARLTNSVEGLAIYAPQGGEPEDGYLIASSQGNSTYVVFDRATPHAYRGTFRIADNEALGIDGTSGTDGVDVVSVPISPDYPAGLLVVQDDSNVGKDGESENQNFKLVSWQDIAEALALK